MDKNEVTNQSAATSTEQVEITPQERAEFEAWRKTVDRKREEARNKIERENYKSIVDQSIDEIFIDLMRTSSLLVIAKKRAFDTFHTAIDMKTKLFNVKPEQRTHTFTNSKGDKRIMVGNYTNDNYRDTVNEGIAIVKEVAESLVKDDESRALVNAILNLLSKDQKGNLKPSRVIQLRQLSEELQNDRLLEGINIIEESYQPIVSKTFVRCDFKNEETNAWVNVPLGITEA